MSTASTKKDRAPRASKLMAVGVFGGVCVVMLVLAEIFLRLAAPIDDPLAGAKDRSYVNRFIRSEHKPNLNVRTEMEPGMSLTGVHHFTTNNVGLRGDSLAMPKPANEYRIAMIGGSTVECFDLDDSISVTGALQRELGRIAPPGRVVRVYNAGKSGDRSDDHLLMLSQRIVHLDPDLVIVMLGLNDLRIAVAGFDFHHFDTRPAYIKAFARPPLSYRELIPMMATEFQLGRRAYVLAHRVRGETNIEAQQDISLTSNVRAAYKRLISLPTAKTVPHGDTASFRHNVESIAGVARGNGIPIVLVTQPTTWHIRDTAVVHRAWMRAVGDSAYPADAMAAGLTQLNDITRAAAARLQVPLYDFAKLDTNLANHFYDDAHFNIEGARSTAQGIAALIRTLPLAGLTRPVGPTVTAMRPVAGTGEHQR